MPWHVEKNASKCSPSKPWAVIKDSDGSVAGCHETKDGANQQLKALYANDSVAIEITNEEICRIAIELEEWSG